MATNLPTPVDTREAYGNSNRRRSHIRNHSLCQRVTSTIVVSIGLAGCQPVNEYHEPPPPPVTVAHPLRETVVKSLEYTGTTEAINLVEVRARVEGFLESIEFVEGNQVEAGDLLFTIDPRPFQATLAQAQASVQLAEARRTSAEAEQQGAQAEVANAQAQLARAKLAAASGAVTQAEIDVLETAVLTARATVDAAKASIKSAAAEIAAANAVVVEAKLNLDYTQVRAPITGRAGRRLVDVGNLVGAGESTLLTNVISYDPVYGFFAVSETDLLRFNRQHIEREVPSSSDEEMKLDRTIFLGLGDEEGFPHEGKADYADLAVDQSTGTFLIRGVFPNAKRLIPPGAFIRVQVPGDKIDVLLIDERAIGRDQAGAYLLVVDPNNTVERRTVQLSGKYHGRQAVSGPIGPDDRVIVNGLQRARPGAKVDPQEHRPADDTAPSPPDTAE